VAREGPREELGAREAPIGQEDRGATGRQGGEDGGQGLLLQLVLAPVGRQIVPVVGDLEQRDDPSPARQADLEDLGPKRRAVEGGPIDAQAKLTQAPQAAKGMGQECNLHREGIDLLVLQEAREALQPMEQVVLRVGDAALGRTGEGPG
jgi:hypothetical protein